jgi:septum formation protein
VSFEVADTAFDEDGVKAALRRRGSSAAEVASALAEAKARVVTGNGLVLGCDQTLELDDGEMLDKPRDLGDALAHLRALSGRVHRLQAAAVMVEAGQVVWRDIETVSMHVRPLGEAFLQDYLAREWDEIRWSVGCYHVEGAGVQLFDRIDGSHFAVLGLPLLPLLGFLRSRRILPS